MKACASLECRRNEASLKAASGSGCDARRLSTGRSIRAWRTLCGRQMVRNSGVDDKRESGTLKRGSQRPHRGGRRLSGNIISPRNYSWPSARHGVTLLSAIDGLDGGPGEG
jgi:hypothetical protein